MEACGINFFYLRAVFPLTLMLATGSAQVCVPLGHSSLYFILILLLCLLLIFVPFSNKTKYVAIASFNVQQPNHSKRLIQSVLALLNLLLFLSPPF